MTFSIDERMDATGLICPEPVMLLHDKIRAIESGMVLEVVSTDPSTQRDVPRFCEFLGHELLHAETVGETFIFIIRKG